MSQEAAVLPCIEYGSTEGQHFTRWRFDELEQLAVDLFAVVPSATGWKIWYDAGQDFYHLGFDLDGHSFDVRFYQVFAITRSGGQHDGPDATKVYGHGTWPIIQLFASGRHKTWADKDEPR